MNNILSESLERIDQKFENKKKEDFLLPKYDPKLHVTHLANEKYYFALLHLRHGFKKIIDTFFDKKLNAIDIDLFMLTPSISSPVGPGSDSEPLPIKFGKYNSFLVDSSQFGFEPLLMNGMDAVYCYLPSMRGEDPDKRHLNQFYHCEAELNCDLDEMLEKIEDFVQFICGELLKLENILSLLSESKEQTILTLKNLSETKSFPRITFEEAVNILVSNGKKDLVNFTDHGNDISAKGEKELLILLEVKTPVWITHFDRDRVPFYQKVDPANSDKVLNADLIFPSLIENSFAGEVIGAGQRQNNVEEMMDSLKRQGVSSESYEWYINLRNLPNYKDTSGFGMGIERFLTWILCREDIKETIIYPRLKNRVTYP